MPAIADDSGLEVDALQGAPGIYSARYAGEHASDEDNLRKLLAALDGRPRVRARGTLLLRARVPALGARSLSADQPGELGRTHRRRAARQRRLRLRPDLRAAAARNHRRGAVGCGKEPAQSSRPGTALAGRAAEERSEPVLSLPPLALYVHMPWCVRKCPYCDFNSHAAPESIPQQQYIDALIEDLAIDAAAAQGRATRLCLLRRRDAESVRARAGRALSRSVRARGAVRAGCRDYARSEPRHDRARPLQRLSRRRHQPRFARRADFDAAHLQTLGRIHGSGDIARAVEEVAARALIISISI